MFEFFNNVSKTTGDAFTGALNKVSDWGSGAAEDIKDYYVVPDKDSYLRDSVSKQTALFKENFGKDPDKEQLKNFQTKAEGLFSQEELDKKMRQQITSGVVGGALGALLPTGGGQSGPISGGSARGGSTLGTGYVPPALAGKLF